MKRYSQVEELCEHTGSVETRFKKDKEGAWVKQKAVEGQAVTFRYKYHKLWSQLQEAKERIAELESIIGREK
ncbi:hypothetical protein N9937_00805 [bacterium]|nr:hypothetical protein [bacterium]